jgi:hypothetical protein
LLQQRYPFADFSGFKMPIPQEQFIQVDTLLDAVMFYRDRAHAVLFAGINIPLVELFPWECHGNMQTSRISPWAPCVSEDFLQTRE